ncbi:MAG: CsbD family protein [Proteobacteria bacterium]|nr:CsbD family protein [Pseudomonadota bacterium]
MNENQVKGATKDIAGKVQQKFGEAIDSPEQQVKGVAKQVEGKTQKAVGDVQQAAEDADKESRQQR